MLGETFGSPFFVCGIRGKTCGLIISIYNKDSDLAVRTDEEEW